jgi:hypothetical protein
MALGTGCQIVEVLSMVILNHKGMRRLVSISTVVFLLGMALELVLNLFEPSHVQFPAYLHYLTFYLMMAGPLLLLSGLVFTLLPGIEKKIHSWER